MDRQALFEYLKDNLHIETTATRHLPYDSDIPYYEIRTVLSIWNAGEQRFEEISSSTTET